MTPGNSPPVQRLLSLWHKQCSLAWFIVCVTLFTGGCATQRFHETTPLGKENAVCLHWFERIDAQLIEDGREDAGVLRMRDFPYLRLNRFIASMRDHAITESAFAQWLEHLRQLDESSRLLEFANLSAERKRSVLSALPAGESFDHTVHQCGKRLTELILGDPEYQGLLLQQANVSDAYQTWKRIIGGYALVRYAAEMGVERLHRELNLSFRRPLAQQAVQGRLMQYAPLQTAPLTTEDIGAMLHPAYANPLAIPSLAPEQLQQIVDHFAPIWEIDTRNNNDQPGMVMLDVDGHPQIDSTTPTVYTQHAFTRWQGKVLLQLVYQIWLPAREKTGVFDLYGGKLDSVIWRVTLSPDGHPVAFDSIHGCGCYYLLFPGQGYRAITPKDNAEPVLSPMSVPDIPVGKRVLLRLATRTHYLQQLAVVPDISNNTVQRYAWQASEQLRSMPMQDGTHRSLFDTDGIINLSRRGERFFLWPFGVASPGAMRQWGTHAIAFIGRRHFDDPFLLEKLIEHE